MKDRIFSYYRSSQVENSSQTVELSYLCCHKRAVMLLKRLTAHLHLKGHFTIKMRQNQMFAVTLQCFDDSDSLNKL